MVIQKKIKNSQKGLAKQTNDIIFAPANSNSLQHILTW
ncbi:hypothetical protein C7972_12028 [Arenibacter sp. ARW7G5Y1]|nr:hypothetical protein C7972_12028 [Arenibacter sp. ARW7G5Y1]